jgi:Fe-S oxidoreductase
MTEAKTHARARFDLQGDLPDEERVLHARNTFVKEFGVANASQLDACVRCGLCAEACHFYVATGDAKYTPIHKLEPLKRAYRNEVGTFAPLRRLLGLAKPVDLAELEEWEELIYDSCTMCGRCTQICPMGIDIASLVEEARHGMYEAGLVPDRLAHIARNAETQHSPFGTQSDFIRTIHEIEGKFDIALPLDKERADILVTLTPSELEDQQDAIAAMQKIFDGASLDWTLSSEAFEATNFGYLSGNLPLQRDLTRRIIDHAAAIGAKTLVLPECGHAYGAARWEAAEWYDGPVPVNVLHIVEFLDELIGDGRIRLDRMGDTGTFHYPCQQFRRGGLKDAPRRILAALGMELIDMKPSGDFSYCCGGGGGVVSNERAAPLRAKVFAMKRQEVEETGAEHFVTSCGICALTFQKGAKAAGWDRMPESLVVLVAQHLVGPDRPASD